MRFPHPQHVWISSILAVALAQDFSDATLGLVQQRLDGSARASWELGTRAQALLELHAEQFSVFYQESLPNIPPSNSIPSSLNSSVAPIFEMTRNVINARPTPTPTDDAQALFADDGSAADPASLGVAALLANWTKQPGAPFGDAARQQLNFLLYKAPRTPQGAISHRNDQAQLWSDFVFMVPPFLAYYGAIGGDSSMIQEAYNQCKLYRDGLMEFRGDNYGLWKHIQQGQNDDPGHWSTGNGWAAQGMLRVYATIAHSQYANEYRGQQRDLITWVTEIQNAMYKKLDGTSSLFRNYASDPSSFLDGASAALMAASVYRVAVLAQIYHNIPNAEKSRKAIAANNHIDSEGWLTPVVDPHSVGREGEKSPEGQAFVLMMQAAYEEWKDDGERGANSAKKSLSGGTYRMTALFIGVSLSWIFFL